MKRSAFLGLRTVIYHVPGTDMDRAKTWYRTLLGIEPYFDQPFYIGFNVGGFELGLHPSGDREPHGPGRPAGPASYWGVERMTVAWPRALGLGAVAVSAPQDVGDGIQVATVRDPFGNLIGLIENPHFPNSA